ncbi:hypothetical protein OG481_31295 [Streptomyces longwoodensis]|uniref:hypothetical protein n=1 Tax=Streptomyces longwoodensis TaxID=68231 RepID=UPI002DD8F171|nr:hypothetical protein [Streptomyces longwoodensis]WRY92704.1 hypothetical protein OG481_31295 [Streptomyces longwoodensis]
MSPTALDGTPWSAVDGPSLARAAAALQLIPQNVPRLVRLQRLAGVAACLPHRPEAPRLSPSRLRTLLKNPVIAGLDVRAQEDPYDDLYTAEIAFHGGPYLVAQGLTSRSAFTLNLLLRSIFGPNGTTLPGAFRQEAHALTDAVLRLSHTVLIRAGLGRGIVVPTARNTEVFVPGAGELSRLCEAVIFDKPTWQQLVPGPVAELLAPLTVRPGQHTFPPGPGPDETLVLTPVLAADDSMIVANPGELAAALRHRLFVLAGAYNCRPQFAELLRREVLQTTTRTLTQCGARPAGPESHISDVPLSRRLFTVADDTFLDLLVITDDLSDYDDEDPYGQWNAQTHSQRVQDLLDPPGTPTEHDARTLRMVINQSFGRTMFLGIGSLRRPGPFLMLTADDLQVMADLDGGDPLFLWRFAQAETALRNDVQVISFGTLDTYGLYREHAHSFYLTDERRPTLVTVDSDFSTHLRAEAQRRFDRHEVSHPDRDTLVAVSAVYGTDTAPVYRTEAPTGGQDLLVELAGLQVWVTAPGVSTSAPAALRDCFLEAAAYWIWQLAGAAPGLLPAAAGDQDSLTVEMSYDPRAWAAALAGKEATDGTDPWIRADTSAPGQLRLELSAAGWPLLQQETNDAERILIHALATAAAVAADTTTDLDDLIDRIAPLGPKKMLHVVSGQELLLRSDSLPAPRLVQPAVSAVVLDELGQWLTREGTPPGAIAPDQRLRVLNQVVAHYFHLLQSAFAELSPDGLLRQLLQRHEALLNADAVSHQGLPARIACFGPTSQTAQELARISRRRVEAAQASRFLIEYAAAVPPSGQQQLTLDRYDRLMALAADLISRAMLSDAIRHEFSDASLSLLDSGRLGVSRADRFETGTNTLALARAEAALQGAAARTITPAGSQAKPPSSAVEEAMRAEFGFTLTELADGIGTLIALGEEHSPSESVLLPAADVTHHLNVALGWPEGKTTAFLHRLSLQPRADFLSVKADAWPWRFNREWSYARRPLIQVQQDNTACLAWAPRHLWSTGGYWSNLVYSGRLRATSPAMKTLLGSIRQDNNKDFERQVETALEQAGCQITACGVAKIQGRRLTADGHDLGDIDALGISLTHKKIFVAEAKDFEMARNPAELANEADHLIRGDKSARYKISRRAQWIQSHLAATLHHYTRSSDTRGWSVIPVIVTSRDLMASRVLQSDVPVVPIAQAAEWVRAASRRAPRRRGSR